MSGDIGEALGPCSPVGTRQGSHKEEREERVREEVGAVKQDKQGSHLGKVTKSLSVMLKTLETPLPSTHRSA